MDWEKVLEKIKVVLYWVTIVRPIMDILIGAYKGVSGEIKEVIKKQKNG